MSIKEEIKEALENQKKYIDTTRVAFEEQKNIDIAKAAWEEVKQMVEVVITDSNLLAEVVLQCKANGNNIPEQLIAQIKDQYNVLSMVENNVSQKFSNYGASLLSSTALMEEMNLAYKAMVKSEAAVCGNIVTRLRDVKQKIAKAAEVTPSTFE